MRSDNQERMKNTVFTYPQLSKLFNVFQLNSAVPLQFQIFLLYYHLPRNSHVFYHCISGYDDPYIDALSSMNSLRVKQSSVIYCLRY